MAGVLFPLTPTYLMFVEQVVDLAIQITVLTNKIVVRLKHGCAVAWFCLDIVGRSIILKEPRTVIQKHSIFSIILL